MKHTVVQVYTSPSGSIQSELESTSDGNIELDIALGASDTDKAITFSATIANIKAICFSSDVDCTIETNSSSAPQESITLTAGVPLIWAVGLDSRVIGDIFAGNITALYATNDSAPAAAGTLKIRAAIDVTP